MFPSPILSITSPLFIPLIIMVLFPLQSSMGHHQLSRDGETESPGGVSSLSWRI